MSDGSGRYVPPHIRRGGGNSHESAAADGLSGSRYSGNGFFSSPNRGNHKSSGGFLDLGRSTIEGLVKEVGQVALVGSVALVVDTDG